MPEPDDTQVIEIDADALDRAASELRSASHQLTSTAHDVAAVRLDSRSFGSMNSSLATASLGLAARATELVRLSGDVVGALGAAASDVAQDWRSVEQSVSDSLALAQADLDGARELL